MTLPVGASRSSAALNPTSQLPAQLGLKARSYLALTKPRIIELLLVTTLPTMFVARRGVPSVTLMALTMIGGALAAGGANAFNMVLDRDIDRLMKRTQKRPLVTGEVTPAAATVFAVVLEVGAFFELWLTVNMLSAILAVSATAFYVFVYTILLKRTSSQNIVIGGAAGAVPVLVGWISRDGKAGMGAGGLVRGHLHMDATALLVARHPLSRGLRHSERPDAPGRRDVQAHGTPDPLLLGDSRGVHLGIRRSRAHGDLLRDLRGAPRSGLLAHGAPPSAPDEREGGYGDVPLLDHLPDIAVRRHGCRRGDPSPLTGGGGGSDWRSRP